MILRRGVIDRSGCQFVDADDITEIGQRRIRGKRGLAARSQE
jgi:hypothetical protein